MNAVFPNNCRPHRKQLSEQLDRFDKILDGLSEGLNGAITDAVRDGTRLAIKDAVIELLTDPTLRAKLHQAAAPELPKAPVPQAPSLWSRFKDWVHGTISAMGRMLGNAATSCGQAIQSAGDTIQQGVQMLRCLGSLRRLLWIGVGVGVTAATVSIFAPHVLSAAFSGIATAVAAMTVQAGIWTRRSLRIFSLN